ncbi:hypothetical protein KVT40_006928 [Elsinoe batatas]|uniref:Uncharacterized protein n=1 Tax=Elsinoe batatas TaxID=2601811 RepID=A0A8K0KXI7_9PEZI|nr:hypothetical protein KVT40_006928 [Elsinoe batatas]
MEGYDPKGNLYVLGLCECEVPEAIRILAIEVIKALPRVAGVACSAMLGGLNLVVDLGTTVMPGGIAVKGLKQAPTTWPKIRSSKWNFKERFDCFVSNTPVSWVDHFIYYSKRNLCVTSIWHGDSDIGHGFSKHLDTGHEHSIFYRIYVSLIVDVRVPAATYAVGECSENFPAFCPTEDDEDALTENLPDIDDAETVESNPEDGIEKRSPTLVKRGGARTFTVKHTAGDIAVTSVPYPKRKDFVEAVRSGNDPKIYQKVFDWSKNDKVNGVKAQIWDGIRAQSSSDFKRLLKRSAEPASHDEKKTSKRRRQKPIWKPKNCRTKPPKRIRQLTQTLNNPAKGLTVGTFQYLQHREVKKRLYQEIKDVRKELAYFEAHGGPFAAGTVQIWDDFIVKLFDRIESRVRSWYATDRQTALLTFQQAKRDFENEQRRCADKNTNGKRPKQEDLPHYITYALKIIPRYQKLATKLVMRKESEIDVDFDMNFPEEVNIGEFIMAPFQPKTGADTCANVGGNLAGLLGSLGGIAAPA